MNEQIESLLKDLQNKLKLEGIKRVFEEGYELRTADLNEPQDPEEFTRSFLIDKILFDLLNVNLIGRNRKFYGPKGERKVDYAVSFEKSKILIEAKPINANLYDKSPHGVANQIKGVFTLGVVQKDYKFGIATDGLKWIFINEKEL